MNFTGIIIACIVGAVAFTVYIMFVRLSTRKEEVGERVKRMNPSLTSQDEQLTVTTNEALSPLGASLENTLSVLPVNISATRKRIEPLLAQAGISSPDAVVLYLFVRTFGAAAMIMLAITIFFSNPSFIMFIVAAIVAVLGITGADLYLTNKKQNRQQKLSRSFPDAIDLVLVCVESGLALDGALSRVCKELGHAHPEITQELNRTRLELTLLNDRPQALQNLALRTDLPSFKAFTASLIQTEKFGTSLADTLRILAEDFRLERLNIAEQKAGRLPALITLPLMLCLIPALFMVILGPAIISVIQIFSK